MLEPYYRDDAGEIYLGDCRDVLPQLPQVDLALTDPPYNTDEIGKRHFQYGPGQVRLDDWSYHEFCQEWFAGVRDHTENIAFTCGISHIWEYPPAKWVFAWLKPSSPSFSKMGGYNVWEPLLYYGRYRKVVHDTFTQVPLNFIKAEWKEHPCPKPPPLWAAILAVLSDPGDLILDPMVGSGTTSVVAKHLNRRYIGIDIKERYCEITANRLRQTVMDLSEVT